MHRELPMTTPRRDFLGWLGGAALIGAQPGAILAGPDHPAAAQLTAFDPDQWDMTWVRRLHGDRRSVFDAPDPAEGDPLLRAHVIARQVEEIFGTPVEGQSRVLVLRHLGIHLAMNDRYWRRFEVGREHGFVDADGHSLGVNPVRAPRVEVPAEFRELTLEAFQRSGGVVLACHLALRAYVAPRYAATGLNEQAALEAAVADLLPGIILQPSGVFAVAAAQHAGCAYVPVS
jgi:hypothetical protein